MRANCIVFSEPGSVGHGEIDVPEPGPGQLVTRTLFSGVSTGTESRVLSGKQEGSVFPLIPGYENVGEIVAAGPRTMLQVGTRVFVAAHRYDSLGKAITWGAHVSHSITDEGSVNPIPDGVAPELAVYGKVSAISLHGVKRGRLMPNEWVVVLGLGLIGHLVVQHAVARGGRVIAIDVDAGRSEAAKRAGAEIVLDGTRRDVVDEVKRITGGGANVAFDATGRSDTLDVSASMLKPRAWHSDIGGVSRLVIQGSIVGSVCLDYTSSLFMPEIDVITARDNDRVDIAESLIMMATGAIDPGAIEATEYAASDAENAYRHLLEKKPMRIFFRW
ncbi:MAG: hypothetical protein EA426_19315 [Spirochaetaceae bacterium]|nr:MAG: hypothetical protein EA426_19315 [Spirochaetaceae bacterium]